ncbi:Retinol dehydrogenase 13 [Fasciola gigantica]|uniref:Retinol dehydrogenase 13 n=1 Tax=Fasciola gigantica TaxID=46835 RepID=A0A504YI46_FASGI|nr:Retinol dehydrogenase 13 [Fasciola gigantica]
MKSELKLPKLSYYRCIVRVTQIVCKKRVWPEADGAGCDSLKPIKADQLIVEILDLGSLESIRQFAAKVVQNHPKMTTSINNACPLWPRRDKYSTTKDGFEQTIGVNHLGHFLLTELLLPAIKAAAPSRIINVSSVAHKYGQRLLFGLLRPMTISAWEGAQTTLYTVLMDSPTPGGYYSNCALKAANRLVNDERERLWLWEKSCELVGLPKN